MKIHKLIRQIHARAFVFDVNVIVKCFNTMEKLRENRKESEQMLAN